MSRLVREVALMEILDHENVVHLYETYETADSLYLVMEYVPGFNLDEYLQQCGALHEDEARLLFRQIVAAVDYCHRRWVVHRDLKVKSDYPRIHSTEPYSSGAQHTFIARWACPSRRFWPW